MKLRVLRGAIVVVAMALAVPNTVHAQAEDKIVNVAPGDAAMEAAKVKGRETLASFYQHLAKPAADESRFAVKFNLNPKGKFEYIWAGELVRKKGKLTGRLSGEPITPGFVNGQKVRIDETQVIDWGYGKNGVMQGNFTTRVLIDMLPADEAKEYRQALGWE